MLNSPKGDSWRWTAPAPELAPDAAGLTVGGDGSAGVGPRSIRRSSQRQMAPATSKVTLIKAQVRLEKRILNPPVGS